ncbi:hypothetical protein E4U56_005725 [Claviceps arundinis]|uniref:Uncharacterized protein n=1 Tax=Claviceps arundinis TaxID=1623583 RepID=A0A9P7MM14_9HYPO|nr:hypothetical protein E4U56_005725 [Claviceps arundinis]
MGQISGEISEVGTKTILSELVLRKHDLALVHDNQFHYTHKGILARYDTTDGMDHSSGTMLLKKIFFAAKDYGDTPSLFITAFANYIVVYYRLFGVQRLDVFLAQIRFLSYVLQL